MAARLRTAALTLCCIATTAAAQRPPGTESALTRWYRAPAREWVEALPVGNGRLGAMVFGGTSQERIQLNEQTVWSGDATAPPPIGPSIAAQLPAIRKLLFDGKYAEGEAAAARVILTNPAIPKASYQTLGVPRAVSRHGQGIQDGARKELRLHGIVGRAFRPGGEAGRKAALAGLKPRPTFRLSRAEARAAASAAAPAAAPAVERCRRF